MTDTAPLARDPANAFAVRGREVCAAAQPGLGVAKLQILSADPDAWLEATLGVPSPAPLREIRCGGVAVAWLAPGEWLATGPEGDVEQFRARCADMAGAVGLMVALGHARAAYRLNGAAARAVLAAHCPLDLSDAAMPVGAAARSLFADAGVFISRKPDNDGHPDFLLIFDQTMSRYAERLLGATISGECA